MAGDGTSPKDCCTKLRNGPVMTGESLFFLGAEVEGFSAGLLGDSPEEKAP